jgi:GT2 family glycosyltransferase
MPKLSIIIVSYNVCHFLEQTIRSILRSSLNSDSYEIIVVDNDSSDATSQMMEQYFPNIRFIANKQNTGFSKANNQGIAEAKGSYVLLLNPDTVLAENTLESCVKFMDKHPNCGALGVRMIDGGGKFLPESKRGLPTPKASFYKIFGLAKLFPKNKIFGQYHLNYLPEFEINKIDVLSGAFMFMRKEALEKAGLLDEAFFMYGEDIDLSYRIQLAGYDNYYLPTTTIIHYKGESTKKDSVNYVKVFYQAMFIFAKKHFALKINFITGLLIYAAIYLRAFISVCKQFIKAIWPAFLEFLVLLGSYIGVTRYWEVYNKYVEGGAYPTSYFYQHLPLYVLILISGIALGGGYKKFFSGKHLWRGIFIGIATLILIYAFLPENLRYSRAILILGAILGLGAVAFLRFMLNVLLHKRFALDNYKQNQVVFVGSEEELIMAKDLLFSYAKDKVLIGRISPSEIEINTLGTMAELRKIIEFYKVNEVILSAKSLGNKQIIDLLALDYLQRVRIKILPPDAQFIIGSFSKHTQGSIYTKTKPYTIQQAQIKRQKRRFDIISSVALLVVYPLLLLKSNSHITSHIFNVLIGKKTWVAYDPKGHDLPKIKEGVILIDSDDNSVSFTQSAKSYYATNYHWRMDLEALITAVLK